MECPSYAINLKMSWSGLCYTMCPKPIFTDIPVKVSNKTKIRADMCWAFFLSAYLYSLVCREGVVRVSMSKYWYGTPLSFRLGFVGDVGLLKDYESQSRTVCCQIESTIVLSANRQEWNAQGCQTYGNLVHVERLGKFNSQVGRVK